MFGTRRSMKTAAWILYTVFVFAVLASFLRQPEWDFRDAERDVSALVAAASAYKSDMNVWPSPTDWSNELTGHSASSRTYYEGSTVDPWHHDYLILPGSNGLHVYSMGADGVSRSAGEDADDISSWTPAWRRRLYYMQPWIIKHLTWALGGTVILLVACRMKRETPGQGRRRVR